MAVQIWIAAFLSANGRPLFRVVGRLRQGAAVRHALPCSQATDNPKQNSSFDWLSILDDKSKDRRNAFAEWLPFVHMYGRDDSKPF